MTSDKKRLLLLEADASVDLVWRADDGIGISSLCKIGAAAATSAG
jgi:hypothetical protein